MLDDAGKVVAEGPDGSLTRLLSADGRYYARVLANSGSGIYGSYILDLSVADRTFPQVVAVNGLPVPGGISDVPLYRFDVVVDKELAADSVRGDASELRHAGADGQFGDADDVLYTVSLRQPYERGNTIELIIDDGPLPHGKYRLQISSSITDVTGNALDGNRDGNGGDAYVHEFSLDLPADDQQSTFIGSGGTTRDTAVALPLMPDASVPELLLGKAVGVVYPAVYQDYWRDSDWWQIQLEAGDRVSIRVDSIDVQLDPYVALTRANGSELRSNDNAGPGNGAFISSYSITESGTYYVHVGKYTLSTSSGMYRLRVDVARGLPMESDAEYGNDSMGGANGLTLVQDGSLRKGSIIGLIMAGDSSNTDDDYFSLGQLTGGNTVQLWLERPASSTLDGVVRLRDSLGRILPDEDGNSADDRLTATLTSDGVYYVEVLAASGAGTSGYYLLHAQVGDTLGPGWQASIASPSSSPVNRYISSR